jgi:hypothetical protein
VVHEAARTTFVRDLTLSDRETFVNETKINVSANISLRAPPSEPMRVTYTYSFDGGRERSYTVEYPFEVVDTNEPSLGVRVDPVPEGERALVRILVTGNVSGALDLRGEYLDAARIVQSGTHDFFADVAPQGNYTVNVTLLWSDAYGNERNISGKAVIPVLAALPENTDTEETEQQALPPKVVLITEPQAREREAVVWVVGGLAGACLLGLTYLLWQMRDPLRRVEVLLRRAAQLRRALAKKRGSGVLHPAEEARLAELERELSELQKKL